MGTSSRKHLQRPTSAERAPAPTSRTPESAESVPQTADQPQAGHSIAKIDLTQGQSTPNRTGMPGALRRQAEARSGMDLSSVRVHTNSAEPGKINARAYTQGDQIHLAPGQSHHLAHEAWHVVQQRQGRVRPAAPPGGVTINDSPDLEREADAFAQQGPPARAEALPSAHGPRPRSAPVIQRKIKVEEIDAEPFNPQITVVARHWGFNPAEQKLYGEWLKDGVDHSYASKAEFIAAIRSAAAGVDGGGGAPAPQPIAPVVQPPVVAPATQFATWAECYAALDPQAKKGYDQFVMLNGEERALPRLNGACFDRDTGKFDKPKADTCWSKGVMDDKKFADELAKSEKKKADTVIALIGTISHLCDETDGTNRPGSVGDGTSEWALKWEAEHGEPFRSPAGHAYKLSDYCKVIKRDLAGIAAKRSAVTDPALNIDIDNLIVRANDRYAKMRAALEIWNGRVATWPAVWNPDGKTKVPPPGVEADAKFQLKAGWPKDAVVPIA